MKPAKVSNRETWESLEAAIDQGIARSIGVSNFQGQSLYDHFTYKKHTVPSLQIEHHPYITQPDLIHLAQTHGIVVTAHSPFYPQSFLELPPAFRDCTTGLPSLSDSEAIRKIASKHEKTPSQVLLRFATQKYVPIDICL